MQLALNEAETRLSELVIAAQNGERVVIIKDGEAVELVRCHKKRGGIDFDKLEAPAGNSESRGIESGGRRNLTIQPSAAACSASKKTNRGQNPSKWY